MSSSLRNLGTRFTCVACALDKSGSRGSFTRFASGARAAMATQSQDAAILAERWLLLVPLFVVLLT